MNALLLTAIAKVTGKLTKNATLPVGKHNVNTTVVLKVTGTVQKLADTTRTPTVSIPLKATLALCLAKAGIQRDNIAKILVESMTEALNADKLGDETIKANLADVDAAMERVTAITEALPREAVKGSTLCDLHVEVEEMETVRAGLADPEAVETFLDRFCPFEQ